MKYYSEVYTKEKGVPADEMLNCARAFLIANGRKRLKGINREILGRLILELAKFCEKIQSHNLKYFSVKRAVFRRDFPELYRRDEHLYKDFYGTFLALFGPLQMSEDAFLEKAKSFIKEAAFSRIDTQRKARQAIQSLRVKRSVSRAKSTQMCLDLNAEVRPWKY